MASMTTLVVLVGDAAARTLDRIEASNVSPERLGEAAQSLPEHVGRHAEAWRRALRHGSVYTLCDFDPLAPVLEAWGRRLTGGGDDLELAIGLVPDLPAPDYYLVDPGIGDPAIHWYAQHLRSRSAARVELVELSPKAVLDRLGSLPTGPELGRLAELAASARDYVPTPEVDQPLTTPSGRSLATGAASPASRQAATT